MHQLPSPEFTRHCKPVAIIQLAYIQFALDPHRHTVTMAHVMENVSSCGAEDFDGVVQTIAVSGADRDDNHINDGVNRMAILVMAYLRSVIPEEIPIDPADFTFNVNITRYGGELNASNKPVNLMHQQNLKTKLTFYNESRDLKLSEAEDVISRVTASDTITVPNTAPFQPR